MVIETCRARSVKIMNTIFKRTFDRKWTLKSSSDVKKEINFIITITNRRDFVKHVMIINKVVVGTDHSIVRSESELDLGKESNKLKRKPPH